MNLKILQTARNTFAGQQTMSWDLLHEMLRVDLDPSHPMHAPVSAEVDALLTR